jgi:multiple sugar transport system substrate-binding protein
MLHAKRGIASCLIVLLVTMLALTGCSSSNNDSKASSSNSPSASAGAASTNNAIPVKLSITWWGSQTRHDYTQQLLDLYTKQNPHVTFEATPSGWDGYFDKLSAQAAGGKLPDIIQMDYGYIATFSNNNLLADLKPFVDSGTIDYSLIDANLAASGEVGGKLTGAVLSSAALATTYNPEVFEKAGVSAPTSDWTWQDFVSNMEQIQSKTQLYGVEKLGDIAILQYWIRQHGASLYSADSTSLGYSDDKIISDFLAMLKSLTDKKAMPNPDEWSQIASKGKEAEPVVTGEGGTTFDWSNFAVIASGSNPNLKLVTPPLDDNKTQALWIKPGMFFSTAESSKNKEEAAKFIDWFINSKEANDLIKGERGIPVSSKAREDLKPSLTPQQQDMFAYIDTAIKHSSKIDPPEPAGNAEVVKLFTDITNQVMYDKSTAEKAAADFRAKANDILARNSAK